MGIIISAGYAGGLAGALVLSRLGEIERKGRLLVLGAAMFGGMLVAFAYSRSMPLSLTLFGLSYAGILLYDTTVQTLLQIVVPDRMRGRVLGFRSMSWGVVWLLGF